MVEVQFVDEAAGGRKDILENKRRILFVKMKVCTSREMNLEGM